eukprot:1582863-Alexandrium_andersonii.AAC.1
MWGDATLVPLHKGKSAPQDPESYRGISVADAVPKVAHSVLRQHLYPKLVDYAPHHQCCGIQGRSTD